MIPSSISKKRILFGCLDWGTGHVSRSIPLIKQLVTQENELFIWCSEKQKAIFQQFDLKVTYHIGFESDFSFKGDGDFFKEMARNGVEYWKSIRKERKSVGKLVRELEIECVISDHRYGLYSSKIPSVFMTHQVQLPSGKLSNRIHRHWMKKFSTIWIVDERDNRLAGKLSENSNLTNSYYIGYLSRFETQQTIPIVLNKIVAIISGPEPYNILFFNELLAIAQLVGGNWTFISSYKPDKNQSFPIISDWKTADAEIQSAEWIVSRCGYSTLMDLKVLNKKAILIPTAGQLEQEYLAQTIQHENWKVIHSTDEILNLHIR